MPAVRVWLPRRSLTHWAVFFGHSDRLFVAVSRQLHVMAIYVREGTRWRAARYQETPIDRSLNFPFQLNVRNGWKADTRRDFAVLLPAR